MICVYGPGHFGYTVAGCLATKGIEVKAAWGPGMLLTDEPGLVDMADNATRAGKLKYDPSALSNSEIVWITYDTPLDEEDRGKPDWVRQWITPIAGQLADNTIVILSSQVPVGFTDSLQQQWQQVNPTLRFAYCVENIRHGHAIKDFMKQSRMIVGVGDDVPKVPLISIFQLFTNRIEWTSLRAAEMSKHAVNGLLAITAVYANELSRLCDKYSIDYKEVETALRTEDRIGELAYVGARGPIAGSLLRDIEYLRSLSGQSLPIVEAVKKSNNLHRDWSHTLV